MSKKNLDSYRSQAFYKLAYFALQKRAPFAKFSDGQNLTESDRRDLHAFASGTAAEFERQLNKRRMACNDPHLSVTFCTFLSQIMVRVQRFANLEKAVEVSLEVTLCLLRHHGIYLRHSPEKFREVVLKIATSCVKNGDVEFKALQYEIDMKFKKLFLIEMIPNLDAMKNVGDFADRNGWNEMTCFGLKNDLRIDSAASP